MLLDYHSCWCWYCLLEFSSLLCWGLSLNEMKHFEVAFQCLMRWVFRISWNGTLTFNETCWDDEEQRNSTLSRLIIIGKNALSIHSLEDVCFSLTFLFVFFCFVRIEIVIRKRNESLKKCRKQFLKFSTFSRTI